MTLVRPRPKLSIDWGNDSFATATIYDYETIRQNHGTTMAKRTGEPLPRRARGHVRIQNDNSQFNYASTNPTLEQRLAYHRCRIFDGTKILWEGLTRLETVGNTREQVPAQFSFTSVLGMVAEVEIELDYDVGVTVETVFRAVCDTVGIRIDANAQFPTVEMGPFQFKGTFVPFLRRIALMCNGFVYETFDGRLGIRTHADALAATVRRRGTTLPILTLDDEDYDYEENWDYSPAFGAVVNSLQVEQLVSKTVEDDFSTPINMLYFPALGRWQSVGIYTQEEITGIIGVTLGSFTVFDRDRPGTSRTFTSSNLPGTFTIQKLDGTAFEPSTDTDVRNLRLIITPRSSSSFTAGELANLAHAFFTTTISTLLPPGTAGTLTSDEYVPDASATALARKSATLFGKREDTRPPWYRVSNTAHLQAEVNRLAVPKHIFNVPVILWQGTQAKVNDVEDIRTGDVINIRSRTRGLALTKCIVGDVGYVDNYQRVPMIPIILQEL